MCNLSAVRRLALAIHEVERIAQEKYDKNFMFELSVSEGRTVSEVSLSMNWHKAIAVFCLQARSDMARDNKRMADNEHNDRVIKQHEHEAHELTVQLSREYLLSCYQMYM